MSSPRLWPKDWRGACSLPTTWPPQPPGSPPGSSAMAERRRYRTPAALRAAIEARLRERSRRRGVPYARVQLLFLMDRVMARLAGTLGDRAMLKGGLALEFRMQDVRTTRDIDLRVEGAAPDPVDLRRAGRLELGDRFTFDIDPDPVHPKIAGPGVRYEGTRYRVKPRFAGKDYGRAFGLDIAVGGAVTGPVDPVQGDDLLSTPDLEGRGRRHARVPGASGRQRARPHRSRAPGPRAGRPGARHRKGGGRPTPPVGADADLEGDRRRGRLEDSQDRGGPGAKGARSTEPGARGLAVDRRA